MGLAVWVWMRRNEAWMTKQLLRLTMTISGVVVLQVAVGVANLLLYIPPSVTVLHQSVAILLLALCTRLAFVSANLGSVGLRVGSGPHESLDLRGDALQA
jgi:heme A synthase